ncbi:DUF3825 domain-containing protein [Bacillus sp. FJAT-28004]|uniref:DUF3825 domain-containing protein n=1 Tax=Bacillus sp. FJAT-28004 TaxID=1679165 RepID=UPI0006B61B5B|nr:DUF3825 domain-containing protein [Bacillus sp. FJAT-28004]
MLTKNDKFDLPEEFYDFAFMPKFSDNIKQLAGLAESEDWGYQSTESDSDFPILENYIKHTYKRIAEEKKVSFSDDGKYACFNTGLLTPNQEAIFILFNENKMVMQSYWHFWKFARKGEHDMRYFSILPDMAYYFDTPIKLVFDPKKNLVVNYEHIIEDNKERFQAPYNTMTNYTLINNIKGVIDSALERLKRNYKIAVPQYYKNNIQLLLPLCLSNPQVADLALVVEDYGTMYRSATCLTLDMAINNARLLAKPDRDWLQP